MAGFFDTLFGSQSKMKTFNKQSLRSLLNMLQNGGLESNPLYQQGGDFLSNLLSGSPEFMQQFQQPYLDQFNQQIAPGIAERFAGMGTGAGASSSSGLYNSLAQAGRQLQGDLAAQRGQMQLQGLSQALPYASQPFQQRLAAAQAVPGQFYERPGQAGAFQGFAQGVGQALPGILTGNPFLGLPGLFGGNNNKYFTESGVG